MDLGEDIIGYLIEMLICQIISFQQERLPSLHAVCRTEFGYELPASFSQFHRSGEASDGINHVLRVTMKEGRLEAYKIHEKAV